MEIIYLDPHLLAEIAGCQPESKFDQSLEELREIVREEVNSLESHLRDVVTKSFFEQMDDTDIARETGLSVESLPKIRREAILKLKHRLAKKVCRRWPTIAQNMSICPICAHEQKDEIERIALAKSNRQSWGSINRQLKTAVGRIFHPPSIIINHLKYHRRSPNE